MPGHRPIEITTGARKKDLHLRRMSGSERLGWPFEFQVELESDDPNLPLEEFLGQPMSLRLERPVGGPRFFSGIVTRFEFTGGAGRRSSYTAILHPWLWLLTRTSDCRVFQKKTVLEIVGSVFSEHEFGGDWRDETRNEAYRSWEYCVQYRETDFNFVSRLLEQEGIYYYFEHKDGKHTLVLADSKSSHAKTLGYEKIAYHGGEGEADHRRSDCVSQWLVSQEIQPGICVLDDYDFAQPGTPLAVESSVSRQHEHSSFEIYDYPGEYVQALPEGADKEAKQHGKHYAATRLNELQTQREKARGHGETRGLHAGALFELVDYPRRDQNREYLIETVSHELNAPPVEPTRAAVVLPVYSCDFTAVASTQPYRPARVTPKPVVQGPQTAKVVGASGQSVTTDAYGRVKVQFPWDRNGAENDKSSCWVRVSQESAGQNWGALFLPHVGQEVIVEFLEGDPDRPIITGRVYNAANMPPKKLPDHALLSVIRDHAGNEIVFDGTPGDEHIEIYSPHHDSRLVLGRSMEVVTESDEKKLVRGDTRVYRRGNEIKHVSGFSFQRVKGASFAFKEGAHGDLVYGTKVKGCLGLNLDVRVGPALKAAIGASVTVTKDRQLNFNKAAYLRVSKGDLKHFSKKEAWLAGGSGANSQIKCSKKELTLAFGDGSYPALPYNGDAIIGTVVAGLSAVAATALPMGDAQLEIENANAAKVYPSVEGNREKWVMDEGELEKYDSLTGPLINIATMAYGSWKMAAGGNAEDPKLNTTHSKLTLNAKEATIEAGETKIVVEKDGAVLIQNKGSKGITIESEENINVLTSKKVWLLKKVEVADGAVSFRGCDLIHENLKAMK